MYLQLAQPNLTDIKGIGIDIAPISKIAKLVSPYDFDTLSLIFTPSEIEQCQSALFPTRYYAICFAAKEAVGKALGTGLADIDWNEIECTIFPSGLTIDLSGAAQQRALQDGIDQWITTWCYWDDYVMVHVLAQGEQA